VTGDHGFYGIVDCPSPCGFLNGALAFCSLSLANQALSSKPNTSLLENKEGWTYNSFSSIFGRRCSLTTSPLPIFFPTSSPSSMAAPNHATQVSAGGYPHARNPIRSSHPPTPSNVALVEAPRSNERPSIELKISSRGARILNAVVVDSTGRPLYSISSDESHTKLISQRDTTNVATIDWDRSSPRMVFRGKKVKCKEWLPRARPDTE
jgi:hypothetical protein